MSDSGRVDAGGPEQEAEKAARAKPGGPATTPSVRWEPVLPPGDASPLKPAMSGRRGANTNLAKSQTDAPSGFMRAMGAVRMVLPVVQKILPLLEGNIASAVANVLLSRPLGPATNLAPLEDAMEKMHAEHGELRSQMAAQNSGLNRVSAQLEMVREATDRNTLEQKELGEDLHRFRGRVYAIAWIGLGLLAVSIAVNVVLFLRVQRVIH